MTDIVANKIDQKSDDPKVSENLAKLLAFDATHRGLFLAQTSSMEWLLDFVIAKYYFPNDHDKRTQFISLFMNELQLPLRNKIIIFQKIMERYYPKILQEHNTLIKNLGKIRDFRNKMAHSKVVISDDFLLSYKGGKSRYEHFVNGKKEFFDLSYRQFQEKRNLNGEIIDTLQKIRDSLEGENQP